MNITGDIHDNVLTGTREADALNGQGGNDELRGRRGADELDGGLGIDLMIGGTGEDTYWVDDGGRRGADELDGGAGADLMVGGIGDDTYWVDDEGDRVREHRNQGIADLVYSSIGLDNAVFTGLGADGPLPVSAFHHGAATTAAHRVLEISGNIYYDPDGVGGQSAVMILTGGSALSLSWMSAGDFFVY